MKNSAAAPFSPRIEEIATFVWKTQAISARMGIAKLALPSQQHLKCGIFCFLRARLPEFQKDGFLAARFHASSIAFSD